MNYVKKHGKNLSSFPRVYLPVLEQQDCYINLFFDCSIDHSVQNIKDDVVHEQGDFALFITGILFI